MATPHLHLLHFLAITTYLTITSGCTRAPERPPLNQPSSTDRKANQPTPFPSELKIIEEDEKNAFNIGVVHRWLSAVYTGPKDRKSIEAVLRQAYDHYRDEIMAIAPEASHKRIRLNLFSSPAEQHLAKPFAVVEQPAGKLLPDWPPNEVKIEDRD